MKYLFKIISTISCFAVVILLFSCGSSPIIEGASSVTITQNSQQLLAEKKALEEKRRNASIIQLDPSLGLSGLEIYADGAWRTYPQDVDSNNVYVEPGKYRYRVGANAMVEIMTAVIDVEPNLKKSYIHYVVGPEREHIYVWWSTIAKSDEAFYREKLVKFCSMGSRRYGSKWTDQDFPDYAYDACKELIELNDPIGLMQLGRFYHAGKSVSRDLSKAEGYYKRAHELGNTIAGRQLLYLYSDSEKYDLIRSLATDMAGDGDTYAMNMLAMQAMQPRVGDPNIEKALYWATESAKLEDPYGFYLMMELSLRKNKFKPDYKAAAAWLHVYKRRFKEPAGRNGYRDIEKELQSEVEGVDLTEEIKAVREALGDNSESFGGEVCISGLGQNPEYDGKKLEYRLNELDELAPIDLLKPTIIRNLSTSGDVRLEVYLDGKFEMPEIFSFAENFSSKACLYFDVERGFNRFTSVDMNTVCTCTF